MGAGGGGSHPGLCGAFCPDSEDEGEGQLLAQQEEPHPMAAQGRAAQKRDGGEELD